MSIKTRKLPNNDCFHSSKRYGEGIALSYISTSWMVDEFISEPRELEFLEYKENATAQFQALKESFANNSITSIHTARSLGVQREWAEYKFFAHDEINAPENVLVYVNDKGEVVPFSEEERNLILEWQSGEKYPISGIQGHHMKLVKNNPDNIDLAANPDNILFATEEGHREFLHGGNTQNATDPEYFKYSLTMDEKFELTVNYNEDLITLGLIKKGALSVGSSMALYSSIRMLIEWYRLKNDPRPWHRKREELVKTGIATALFGGGLSAVGYLTRISMDGFFADFTPSMLDHFFTEMVAINGSFFIITVTGSLLRYIWEVRKGKSQEEAKKDLQTMLMVATAELLAFSALGLGLDILVDFATDTIMDALIPDPTGILIAARVGYGIAKLGKKVWDGKQNKEALIQCIAIRMNYFYELARNKFRPDDFDFRLT
ncbi:hypothetical protein [Peribacillus loiseleuriae]|uniref:Uncharacterized protein n=1 Tax=Peribacillus loiseleuriae TaxID=1679170 RepID=A0A0K9GXQ5_9BACI|nr:hypothetical protein [Peribacillus loiseleuriae]KMY51032.1 hypothetical protein AC625_17105 [Peribacillus loiseleuriae]